MSDKQASVCVIGGACYDIFGNSEATIIPADSNPGKITAACGGVGRNIAGDLALLGVPVELICGLGNDDNGQKIKEHCNAIGIGLRHSLICNLPTAVYLSLNQPSGEIYGAVGDMRINEALDPTYLAGCLDFINSCAVAVLDTNLAAEACDFLCENVTAKLFVDTVSAAKAGKLRGQLKKIRVLKTNLLEACALLGQDCQPEEAVSLLRQKGIAEVYLTLGAQGVCCSGGEQGLRLNNYPSEVINTTGCGDAFMAGVIYGELRNADLVGKARYGLAAAAICCRSMGSYCEYLSESELLRIVTG